MNSKRKVFLDSEGTAPGAKVKDASCRNIQGTSSFRSEHGPAGPITPAHSIGGLQVAKDAQSQGQVCRHRADKTDFWDLDPIRHSIHT